LHELIHDVQLTYHKAIQQGEIKENEVFHIHSLSFEKYNAILGAFSPQIAEALSYLHATENIVHMNICPHSILISKRGMWKLAGFGFAECPTNSNIKVSAILLAPIFYNRK